MAKFKVVTDSDFKEKVLNVGKKVFVLFWKENCPFCEEIIPYAEEVVGRYRGDFIFYKLNWIENKEIVAELTTPKFPRLLFFKNGEISREEAGASAIRIFFRNFKSTVT